jgi:hypothetical protein
MPRGYTRYKEGDRELLMYAIHNMTEELVSPGKRFSPVLIDQRLVLIAGKALDEIRPSKVEMFELAETVQQMVKQYLNLKISIGISRSYTYFSDAPLAYRESIDALI